MKNLTYILVTLFIVFSNTKLFAQNISCDTYMTEEYISDGQYYNTPIKNGETKSFKVTFQAGNIYRVVACAEQSKFLIFKLIDQEGNILFNNTDFKNSPYWDFQIKNTMEYTIILYLNNPTISIDNAIVIIGYKQ